MAAPGRGVMFRQEAQGSSPMPLNLALAAVLSLSQPAEIENAETAVFAGGCFWCMEADFEKLPGVIDVVSGYSGGETENPTYQEVSSKSLNSGHYEVVEVTYDPDQVSYDTLLEYYWLNVDPTDAKGQFCDKGHSYKTAIFVKDDEQRAAAEASKAALVESGELPNVETDVLDLDAFYPAEGYHQDYYKKSPVRYRIYRTSCGRDRRLQEIWGSAGGGAAYRSASH